MVSCASWLEQIRLVPLTEVASAVGLQTDRGGALGPCPACGARRRGSRDRRFPITLRLDRGRWYCFRCRASGDALSLLALSLTGEQRPLDWSEVRAFCENRSWSKSGASALAVLDAGTGLTSSSVARPDPHEVLALWESALPVIEDDPTVTWLRSRGLDPATVADLDLARVLPPKPGRLPEFARFRGRPWSISGHRLLLPLWGATGQIESLHARAIVTASPATAKGASPRGVRVAGLVFAEAAAVSLLSRGVPKRSERPVFDVVIVEGVPDFLTWASRFGCDAGLEDAPAVFGVLAGSWPRDSALANRLPESGRVVIRTHHDDAGERYAAEVQRNLVGRCRVFRSAPGDGGRDENDRDRDGTLSLDPFQDALPCGACAEAGSRERAGGSAAGGRPLLPLDALPSLFSDLVEAFAERTRAPVELAAIPALAVVATALGPRWRVGPASLQRPPRLWFSLVAPSGAGKTPAARPLLAPLVEIDRRLREEALHQGAEEDKERRRILVTDATPEALLTALQGAAGHGLLVHSDELAALLASFDGYRKSAWGRAVWLSLWSATAVRCLRKTTPGAEVDDPFLVVLAGVQPAALHPLRLKNEDGLVARFLWCHVPARSHGLGRDPDPEQEALWRRAIPLAMNHPLREPQPFTPTARGLLDARLRQWTGKALELDPVAGLLSACYGKAGDLLVRLSALLHGLDALARALTASPSSPRPLRSRPVPASTVVRASRLLEYFLAHAEATTHLVLASERPRCERPVDPLTRVSTALAAVVPPGQAIRDTPTNWSQRLQRVGFDVPPRRLGRILSRLADAPVGPVTVLRLPKSTDRLWEVQHPLAEGVSDVSASMPKP